MNPRDQLEEFDIGQTVERALTALGIPLAKWSILASNANHVFKIEMPDRNALVLRVFSPDVTEGMIDSQLYWLAALKGLEGVRVPQPVPLNNDSGRVVITSKSGSYRQCVLLEWVDGTPAHRPSKKTFERIGQAVGHLHNETNRIKLPSWFEARKLDGGFLFGDRSCLHHQAASSRLGTAGIAVIEETRRQLESLSKEMQSRPEQFGLLHGDLNINNIVVPQEGPVGIIDFDDFGFGHYLFDLGEVLRLVAEREEFPEYQGALIEGYERVRGTTIPKEQLNLFISVSFVNYLNFGFNSGNQEFLNWIDFAVDMIRKNLP